MAYDLKNIYRPNSATPGNAGGIRNKLILIKADDVETFPERDEDLVTITGDIELKEGKFMHTLYVTTKTAIPRQEKVAGSNDDCGGFRVSVEFFHPGFEKPFQEFLAKFATGFNGYVIFEHAKTGRMYLIGEPGNEAVLKTLGEDVRADYSASLLSLAIAEDGKLLLCNSFNAQDFTTALYFIFSALKQFQINPEVTTIYFRENLGHDQEMLLYRYFSGVEILK